MPEFKKEQLQAIEAQGKTIVSASAGSGKTTVMIEKILRLILSGVAVDRILAVTYTKKAAAQMKEKLRDALIKKINDKGVDKEQKAFLKGQLSAVRTADISTIHSLCAKLLKQHFFEGEVSNTFSVMSVSEGEGKKLFSEAMDEVFAEAYASGDEDFYRLLPLYFQKKKDAKLRKILSSAYEKLRTRDDYIDYLKKCGEDGKARFDEICQKLVEDVHDRCRYYLSALEGEEKFFLEKGNCDQSLKLINFTEEYLYALLAEKDYFAQAKHVVKRFPNSQSIFDETPPDVVFHIERTKGLMTDIKELHKQIIGALSYEEEYNRFATSMKTSKALAKYLLAVDEVYARIKREKDCLDYSDLEHLALALLQKPEMQEELHKKYAYVFVDEYQDVNPVQEKLLSYIAGDNVFLVGDVKQSIYGFRGSKSQFFIDKEKEYKAQGHNALVLPQNFRSAPAVLEAVNTQFAQMMTKQNTSVDYEKEGQMVTGGLYADDSQKEAYGRVRVHFCEKLPTPAKTPMEGVYSVQTGRKKGAKSYSAQVQKALQIVLQEKKYGQWYDLTSKQYKKVDYGDIAILYRGGNTDTMDLAEALSAADIPVVSGESVNVCDYPEVKTLMDILSLIDNERQDIPLCSALKVLKGLSNEDLAKIRLACPDVTFYEACKTYAQGEDVLAHTLQTFFADLSSWRLLSQMIPAGELLIKLIVQTSLETKFLSQEGGEDCLARLHRFVEEASAPAPMSVREFLDKLKSLDDKIECPVSGGENAVKMMTMHASKGLEFPVVILLNMGKKLHDVGDSDVLINDDYGLAPFYYDAERRAYYPTLLRLLHINAEGKEQIKDELNVYYVAATRAKYAMHLLFKERTGLANPYFGDSYQAFTDFSLWEKFIYGESAFEVPYQQREGIPVQADEKLVADLEKSITQRYAYGGLENFVVKDSATGLMKKREDPFAAKEVSQNTYFSREEEGDKALRGLAYHAFLEHFDFRLLERENWQEEVSNSLDKFKAEKAFDERYFEQLQVEKLCEILSAPVFRSVKDCKLYKEQDFLVSLAVKDVLRLQGKSADSVVDKEAQMLFQGAIDLLAIGKEQTTIIDYKFSQGDKEYLKNHYAPQLQLYKKAVSKITGRAEEKIKTVIVNIARGFTVEI